MSVVSNIVIYTGVDFQQTFTLENNDSQSALNLTGYTGCAKIKKYESSLTNTPFTVTFTDRLAGKVTISISSTITQNLRPGNYAYDFFIHDNSGNITKISEGQVFVKKSVTRI